MRRSTSPVRVAVALCVVLTFLVSCTIVPKSALGVTINQDGKVELWFSQCRSYVSHVWLQEAAAGQDGPDLWLIEDRGDGGHHLPFKTEIGSQQPGYVTRTPLQAPLKEGIRYRLGVGGGEVFAAELVFRLDDLRSGTIVDFDGRSRDASKFVEGTRCKGNTGVSP